MLCFSEICNNFWQCIMMHLRLCCHYQSVYSFDYNLEKCTIFSSWPSKMLYNCSDIVISIAFVMWFLWIWGGVDLAKRGLGNCKVKSMYIMNIFLQKLNWIALYKLYNRLLSLLICYFCIVVCVKWQTSSWYRGKSRLKCQRYLMAIHTYFTRWLIRTTSLVRFV